jgi:hypothetical protein
VATTAFDRARLLHRGALEGAEAGFALAREDLPDRPAGRGFDEPVGVDERTAEEARETTADRRLSRRHEAGEDDLRHGQKLRTYSR